MWEAPISNGTVHRIGPRVVCSLLLVLVLVLTGVHYAQADTAAITEVKSQAAALEAKVQQLDSQAALLMQKYDSAVAQLAQSKADASDYADQLAQAEQDQQTAENALSDRLTQIYKQGRNGSLDILLSATSWSELVNRASLLKRVSKHDADLLQQVTTFRAQVADRQVKLSTLLEQQQTTADQAQAAAEAVTQQLAQSKQSLTGKETQIAQLEADWQAQQAAQATLQQQAQDRLDAALAAAQAAAQAAADAAAQAAADAAAKAAKDAKNTTTTTTKNTTKNTTTTTKNTTTTGGTTQAKHGSSNVLKPEQIALVAQKAGFSGENLVIAVAVAMAESGSNADAVGRLHTYGLWQILSHAHPTMIDPNDPEASRWFDPYVNATFAYKIAGGGKNWKPWSVYTSGSYLSRMDKARAGVDLLLSDPGAVTPPSVK
jgi:peptidoglycan hydrolase CwlO-like protein